jgi:hypothetical protein
MATQYPDVHNHGVAEIHDNGRMITFTYLDSWNTAHTVTLPVLTPAQIVLSVEGRHKRFEESPGRESNDSRFQRKYISAQRPSVLLRAFQLMDESTRMEFSMMLDSNSHHGISNRSWAEAHQTHEVQMRGDDGRPL